MDESSHLSILERRLERKSVKEIFNETLSYLIDNGLKDLEFLKKRFEEGNMHITYEELREINDIFEPLITFGNLEEKAIEIFKNTEQVTCPFEEIYGLRDDEFKLGKYPEIDNKLDIYKNILYGSSLPKALVYYSPSFDMILLRPYDSTAETVFALYKNAIQIAPFRNALKDYKKYLKESGLFDLQREFYVELNPEFTLTIDDITYKKAVLDTWELYTKYISNKFKIDKNTSEKCSQFILESILTKIKDLDDSILKNLKIDINNYKEWVKAYKFFNRWKEDDTMKFMKLNIENPIEKKFLIVKCLVELYER